MKKGISLLALLATIAVMTILLSAVTISGIATINNAKKMSFATEISMLQESSDAYIAKNNGDFAIGNSIQLDISGVTANSSSQFAGETVTNNKIVLYALDYNALGMTSLKYGLGKNGQEDIYAVSKDTKRVYYCKGIAVGNVTYYTLTQDLKSLINYANASTGPITQDGVIFVPSDVNWTNKNVTVQVKIPLNYVSKSVTVNGTGIASTSSDANYQIYDVNSISGNYTVVANYAIDGSAPVTSAKYDVTNVDTTPPTITLDSANQQLLKSDVPGETYAYFKILSKSDDLSGVKVVKYENERILDTEIQSYFQTNGKTVNKDIITIDPNVKNITVYIEDNAGNWSASFVTVADNVYTGLLQ